jgi:hypothetical protein
LYSAENFRRAPMTPLLAYYGLKSGVRKIGAEP